MEGTAGGAASARAESGSQKAERYAALKRSLKEKFEFNRDAYTEGKTELIAAMTRRAREEMPGRHVPE